MFKKLLAILLFCFTLTAVACGGNNGGEASPTGGAEAPQKSYCVDYKNYMYDLVGGDASCVETDDTIYVLRNHIVWFTDKEYRDWMPLCSRPDCKHSGKNCYAYIDSECIVLYGGYIYFVTGSGQHDYDEGDKYKVELCRMRFDGSEHEVVYDVRAELTPEMDYTPNYSYWAFSATNKYLIIRESYNERSIGDDIKSHIYYYSLDLDTLQAVPLLTDRELTDGTSGFGMIEGVGSHAYGQISSFGELHRLLVDVDLATGETRELGELDGEIMYYEKSCGIVDGRLLILTRDIPESFSDEGGGYTEEHLQHLYAVDLETCELELIAEEPAIYAKWSVLDTGSGYWYGVVGNPLAPEETRGFYVCDLERNELVFLPASEYPEETGGRLSIGRITENFIFANNNYGMPVWYLDKADIGTADLCWRKWKP